jgi:hypothetical protein
MCVREKTRTHARTHTHTHTHTHTTHSDSSDGDASAPQASIHKGREGDDDVEQQDGGRGAAAGGGGVGGESQIWEVRQAIGWLERAVSRGERREREGLQVEEASLRYATY